MGSPVNELTQTPSSFPISTSLRADFDTDTTSERMEDFNIPSNERITLLKAFQEEVGDVPPYFWAFCQVCDLQALQKLIDIARISPVMVRIFAAQAFTTVLYFPLLVRPRCIEAGPPRIWLEIVTTIAVCLLAIQLSK